LLERSGESALPVTLVDGEVAFAGRYPTRGDLARWIDVHQLPIAEKSAAGACCSSGNCC
jgi:hypothetical protein